MDIYLDLIFFVNFYLDFLLLVLVSLILKRKTKIYRLLIGALIGSLSIVFLFININSFELFIYKVFISIIMIIISFGFKSIKYFFNNFLYLYLVSIILGGFLYFLNDSITFKNTGLLFVNNGKSINLLIVILLSPIVLIFYYKSNKKYKEEINKLYNVKLTLLNNKILNLTAFLDTGNNLIDPYKKRPIILINKNIIKNYNPLFIYVPCYTVNKQSMIKCFKIRELVINNKIIKKDVLVGISDNNFNIDGVDLLLHKKII